MKKITFLFALLCASVMGWATINWDAVDYLGSTEPSISMNTYKYALDPDDAEAGPNSIANIQPASGESRLGFYSTYGQGVASCSHAAKILGDQVWVYVDQLTELDTKIVVTLSDASTRAFHLYYKNGGAVDPNAPHASGKGFGTYIAKNVPFYTRVDNKADETKDPLGTVDLYIITYGNKIMGKAKLNNAVTFQGANYSMQFRIWNDGQTGFSEQWAQLREENTTVALIDMNSNYCNLNQGTRTVLPMNTYMETSANTGAVPMFTYTLDYINAPIAGDETAPVISSAVASYNPITGQPTIVITATDANDMFYKVVDPSNNVSYSFSNTIQLTTDESNNVLTYTVYAIDYNGNVSSAENVDVQMKPALSNIASGKNVIAVINPSTTGRIVDGNFNGDRWSSAGAIHYDPVNHPDDYQDWFYINFVNIYDLSAVRIKWETARPNNYTFRTSIDGTNWTIVETYTEYPTANAIVDYILPPNTQGRFFGVWATSGYDNLNWGISPYEVEVYGAQAVIEDHNPPTLNSAVLSGDPEWNQVRIAVEAEDAEDPEIYVYHVVDTDHSIDQECMVSAGIITVTGLSGETTYHFSVKAVDGAGNESDAIVVNATTPIDTSVPLVAAPTPDGTGKEIRPIYSDAFASILAHSFDKDGWGGVPLMEEKDINGNKCLVYNVATANEVLWGMYDNGNNAIIAVDGYHSATGMGVDASAMTHLHLDIWSLQACNNCINININDAALKTLRLSHAGSGWQSYDIALSEFQEGDAGKQIDNVRWMKFNGIGPISGKMALDNVYFWAPASAMKAVSASSNNTTMGSAIVKQGEDEVTMVEENTKATFIATANEGYVFVNWTNLGTVVSTDATYEPTITETTNLVANFDYIRTTYCRTAVMTNNDKTLYLSCSKVADGTYQIRIDGSDEAKINGRNNFNFVINNATNYSNEAYNPATGQGWQVSNEGKGYIVNTFNAADYKTLSFGSHYFAIGAQGGGEFILDNNFPAASTIAWNESCVDTEAPVFAKAEAVILNESSVRLKIQASDNWEGSLTYTIAREAAEPIISNHASGEEFTQDVTGLTAGTEYDFTVTVSDGVNNTNTHIIVTPVGDETKPVMGAASLESKTWNSAIINVAATDNIGVSAYYIVELADEFVAAEGKISVNGLTHNTAYTFTIKAKDAAGNISDNASEVSFSTDIHYTEPQNAAPVPTWPAAQVKSLYSNTYTFAPASLNSYNEGWWAAPVMTEGNVDGNTYLHYNLAADGMIGWQFAEISVATMEKLHIDIFASASGTLTIRPIIDGDGALNENRKTLTLVGQQWNSFDIEMSEFGAHDWSKLFQFSIEYWNAGGLTGEHISVDNVYFYRESAYVDTEYPTAFSASLASESYFSVKINAQASDNSGAVIFTVKNGDDIVATQNAASATATVINVTNLTAGTAYNFNVYVADEAGNTLEPIAVNATTLALPTAAPAPTHNAKAVKSIYSEAYTSAIPVAINFNEWWWQSPTVAQEISLAGNNARYYSGLNTNGSFGITWSGDHKLDAAGYQKVHFHIYPTNSATIEIYPVIQPEGEFHRTSETLVGGQWNEVVIDYSDKTFAPFNQFGIVYTEALGDFFIDNLYFYSDPDYTRNVTDGNYGTICLPQAGEIVGATLFEIADYANNMIYVDEVEGGVMEAGKPYIFQATNDKLDVYYTSATVEETAGSANGLHGFYNLENENAQFDIEQDAGNYILYQNQYWLVSGRAAYINNFRAYIKIGEINYTAPYPGRRRVAMAVNGEQTATGMDAINATDAPVKMVINGQLFILRGEKMYDATGRLVK